MSGRPFATAATPEETPPSDQSVEFRRKMEEVEAAAREWGLRWHQPEGRFVSAMLGAMSMFGELIRTERASFEHMMREGRVTAETEYAHARELSRSADLAVRQVRNAQLSLTVEQENLTVRMIDQTLPLFAERLQKVLVIREQRWNADKKRRRFAAAAAVALAVFLAGYGVSAWSDNDKTAAFDRCLSHPLTAAGHFYCDIDTFAVSGREAAK